MNRIFNALFLLTVGLAGFFYLNHRGLAVGHDQSLPQESSDAKRILGAQAATSKSPAPETLTTLLADTELENELLSSLKADDSVRDEAEIHSVNCEDSRCQVLAEANIDAASPEVAFSAHLQKHPQFGQSLSIAPAGDKPHKRLLSLIYNRETQVSTTH